MRPRPNLPFDKKKARGVGDASAITRMQKATAESADYNSKVGFTNITLGSSSKSGFIWSIFQPGLVYQHSLMNSGFNIVILSATELILSGNTIRIYWTTSRPVSVVVDFYQSDIPSKIGTVQVDNGITMAELSITTTVGKFYKATIRPIDVLASPYTTPDTLYTGSYDVFVIMGQSNSVGLGGQSLYIGITGTDDEYSDIDRYSTPGIKQWRRFNDDDTLFTSATATDFIVDARDMLDHNVNFSADSYLRPTDSRSVSNTIITPSGTVSIRRPQLVGFGYSFAREYKVYTGRDVLLIPCGRGGSSIVDWAKSANVNSLYDNALTRTIAAVNSISGNKLCGILWHQGETEAVNFNNASYNPNNLAIGPYIDTFKQRLQTVITSFRTDIVTNGITGNKTLNTNVPWLIGGLVPAWLDDNSVRPNNGPTVKNAVNEALNNVAVNFTNTAWVTSRQIVGGYDPNDTDKLGSVLDTNFNGIIHFNASSQRKFGKRYFNQYIDRFYNRNYITVRKL